MSYLISTDYDKIIQSSNLTQITGGSAAIIAAAERLAVDEVTGYLVQKYDLSRELIDTNLHVLTNTYPIPSRVYSGSDVYFTKLPAPLFNSEKTYAAGSEVFWIDRKYTAIVPVSPGGADPDKSPDAWDPTSSAAPPVPANTAISNTTYWIKGDNRYSQLITILVDIALYHLHARISPSNVPKVRDDRYLEAKDWLKGIGEGKITANLPKYNPYKGTRIRYGGNTKNINSY